MNKTVAKKIRAEVYGDFSPKDPVRYSALTKLKGMVIKNKDGKEEKVGIPRNTTVSTGLRRQYRLAKKAYKTSRRGGVKKT
jgi:hypothetical protein